MVKKTNVIGKYDNLTPTSKAKFTVPSKEKQEQYIEENTTNPFSISSEKITTPNEIEGYVYLKVDVNKLSDLYGTEFKEIYNSDFILGKTLYYGPYMIDNTPPTIEITDIIVKNSNAKNTIIKFKASDNLTDAKDLRFCLTIQGKEVCEGKYAKLKSSEIEKIENGMIYGQIEYDFTKVTGKEVSVKVNVKDLADNNKTDTKKAKSHTLVYKETQECTNKTIYTLEGSNTNTWGTLCNPTKENNTFEGWYTETNGGGDLITKDTVISNQEKVNVHPKWKTSKVIFRFQTYNGETLTPQTISGNTAYNWTTDTSDGKYYYVYRAIDKGPSKVYTVEMKTTATSVTLPKYNDPKGLNITKSGLVAHSGKEWKCVSGCKTNGQIFKAGTNNISAKDVCDTKNGDCYVTLKVNWNENKVKIKLNTNGGTGTAKNGYSIDNNENILKSNGKVIHEISYGGSLTSQGLLNYNNSSYVNVTRNGYSVPSGSEWNTKNDGTGTSYSQDTVYRASDFCDASQNDCEVTLYLNWKKNPETYTIKYDLNGGSGTFPNQTKTENVTLKLHSNIPTNSGKTFDGWKATNNQKYAAGANYTANAGTTLTAQWKNNATERYVYRLSSKVWPISGSIPSGDTDYYENLQDLIAKHPEAEHVRLKHKLDANNKIVETYLEYKAQPYNTMFAGSSALNGLGIKMPPVQLSLKAASSSYNSNKTAMTNAFENGYCVTNTYSGASWYNCNWVNTTSLNATPTGALLLEFYYYNPSNPSTGTHIGCTIGDGEGFSAFKNAPKSSYCKLQYQ